MSVRIFRSLLVLAMMFPMACSPASEEEADLSEGAATNNEGAARFAPGSFELDSAKGLGRLRIEKAGQSSLTFSIESRLPGNELFAAKIASSDATIESSRDEEYPQTATFGSGPSAIHLDLSRDGETIRVRAPAGPIANVEGAPAALSSVYRKGGGARFVNEEAGSVLRIRKSGDGAVADLSVYNLDTDDAHFIVLGERIQATGTSKVRIGSASIQIELGETEVKISRDGDLPEFPESSADFAGTFKKY